MALPRLKWRPLIVGGVHDPELRAALRDASGAYAIRTKRGHGVVYVGESHTGAMWKTLTRHFNAPDSFKAPKPKGGGNAFATNRPEDYEIAYRVTGRGKREDVRAVPLEGKWIEAFHAAGHPLKNDQIPVGDGTDFDFGANVRKNPGVEPSRHWVIFTRGDDVPVVGDRSAALARATEVAARQNSVVYLALAADPNDTGRPVLPPGAEYDERSSEGNPSQPWRPHAANPPRDLPSGPLVELGLLTRLGALHWSLKDAPVLAYDSKGRLFVVYTGRVVRPSSSVERREYARTHWGASGRGDVRGGVLADPPFVAVKDAGRVIQYTTRKGTDRKLTDYVHEWGEGGRGKCVEPLVVEHQCGDRRCQWNGAIALVGGSYRVSERGIVG